ncbi:hypothetical protein HDU98_012167 [Podochytrium sp. JEL0797]|nr:hypothetical protein HDU98_012167 [Podochytrium sp. JEL0797]
MPHLETEIVQASQDANEQGKRIIVIALDNSIFSDYAFNWALDNGLLSDAHVYLLSVHNITATGAAHAKAESHALLKKYGDTLELNKRTYTALSVSAGKDVKEAIVKKSMELEARMVIIGSRGAEILARIFAGSVSDYVQHHCQCPVLVIKPTKNELEGMGSAAIAHPLITVFGPAV